MAKQEVHTEASRSWWSGTVTALCGRTYDTRDTHRTWGFASVSCKACKRIAKEQRR